MPLGASVGPAGLAVMPYTLTFNGDFFKIADFIKGLDALVETTNEKVAVNGRLITVDGFSLSARRRGLLPALEATFSVTTYLTPPGQGLTAGASPQALKSLARRPPRPPPEAPHETSERTGAEGAGVESAGFPP